MARDLAPPNIASSPLDRVGRPVVAVLEYLGGLVLLAGSAARALVRPAEGAPPLGSALIRQGDWLFGAGLPLVALVHVGMGSFLAMQAYYGATFVEGVGPVVGVGLCRNVAPLMVGMILAGLLAARVTPDLRRRPLVELDGDPDWVPDRQVALGREADPRTPPEPARLAAVRMAAAMVAGPVLGLWGAVIGTLVGGQIAKSLLNVTPPIYYGKALEMLWARDVVGLIVKGIAFGLVASLFACYEGLRGPADPRAVPTAAARAACLSALAILVINGSWYFLMYMAGPAFGPTVLTPPVP